MSAQQSQQIAGRARLLLQTPVVIAAAPPPSTLPPSGTFNPLPIPINQFPQSSSSMNDVANHFSPSLPIILVVLFSAFFSIGFFSLYVRRRDNATAAASSDGRIPLSHSGRVYQDHPNHGVDPDFLRALPLVAYSSAKKKGNNVECVVCLIEFEEQEALRQLPACKHVFHQDCIDMWLFSHSTCPLCRRNITAATGSMSLRWGGSGSFRHLLSRGGSTARSLPPASEDAGTMSLIESNISNTMMETCRPCSAGVTNASPGRHPFAAGNMHAFAGNGGARRQPRMHLARVNSTGHSLQMGLANEGNAQALCIGTLSVSGGSDHGESTHRSGLYRSISELPEHRRDSEW